MDDDGDVVGEKFVAGGTFVEVEGLATFENFDTGHGDFDEGWIEFDARTTCGGEDAAPIGVAAGESGFDEGRSGDGFGYFLCAGFGFGATDFDFDDALSAFAVGDDLLCEGAADTFESCGELAVGFGAVCDGRRTGGAVGEDEERVIGGRVTVDANRVNRSRSDIAQRSLQKRRRNVGVGGDEGERGGHVGMNHAGAFGAADEMDALGGHSEGGGGSFGASVRGADGERKFGERAGGGATVTREHGKGAENFFYGELHADNAGGTDEEFVSRDAETFRGFFDGALRGEIALGSGGAVGVASVDDDGAHVAFGFGEMFFGESDGSGDDEILREDGSGGCRDVAGKNGEIEGAGFFEAAGGGGETKAFGKGGFGGRLSHRASPSFVSRFLCIAIAARTGSVAVPPMTTFVAMAVSTFGPAEKSSTK